jgi:hypothetical protein
VKHFRSLLPFLILALVLSGCGSTSREPYDLTYDGRTITVYPETGTIVDGLNVYRYTASETAAGIDYDITYPNGSRYWWMSTKHGGHGGGSDGYDDSRYLSGDILISALQQGEPQGKVGNIGIGLLLIGLGAVNFFLPELPFYLKYGWAVENAEPSDAYITWTKVGGVIFAVAGLIACFI